MVNQLAIFSAEATKDLLLFVALFGISMILAAVNIVHFHHRRSRWQEGLAAFFGAVALIMFGLYMVNYTTYGYQVLFQAPADAIEMTGAYVAQWWLVNGALMALAGASVCIFAGLLALYGSYRKSVAPVMSAVYA